MQSGYVSAERRTVSILLRKLLLVEGRDALEFFKAILRHIELSSDIQVEDFGGIHDLAIRLRTITATPGFTDVLSVGIIRDAEANANSAFQSVCTGLRKARLEVPSSPKMIARGSPNVSVFILPDCSRSGMLETLCLTAVCSDPIMPCVKAFFDCIREQGAALPKHIDKAYAHAFLASRPQPDLQVGQAAHKGYWQWENAAFDDIKHFLLSL